jgi:putative transposase
MSRGKHTETQTIGALKQVKAGGKAADVAREIGVSKHTIYAWKAKYGGMDVSEAQEAKQFGMRTRGCGSWWPISVLTRRCFSR